MDNAYDIPLDDYGTPYVTIDEMQELLQSRKKTYEQLLYDKETKSYYTKYGAWEGDLLQVHFLIEQCIEHMDEIDWLRSTNGYDIDLCERLQHLWENPLVWADEIPSALTKQFVITGKVAVEKSSEVRNTCSPYTDLGFALQEQRILWFVDQLPTKELVRGDSYYDIPDDMLLWKLILTDPVEYARENIYANKIDPVTGQPFWVYCNAEYLRQVMKCITLFRSPQHAAKIVRRLREDWPDIKAMKLFGVDRCTPEQIAEFEQCLFAGMDRNIRTWEADTHIDLESVFSLRFRRTDEYNRLLQFLETERIEASDSDWTRYALALYEANIFVHRPAGFTKWLPRFCELFGRQVPYQEPNKLKRTACKRDITAYLPNWK